MSKIITDDLKSEVRVSVGVTRNLGDYNSLRLDTSYTMEFIESDANKSSELDAVEEAFKRAWAKVEKDLEAKIAEYEN